MSSQIFRLGQYILEDFMESDEMSLIIRHNSTTNKLWKYYITLFIHILLQEKRVYIKLVLSQQFAHLKPKNLFPLGTKKHKKIRQNFILHSG